MKTILLAVTHGAAAKNILRTNTVKALLGAPDVRVVCLMRFPDRAELYRKEISHERLMYDTFYEIPRGAVERLFSFLKFRLIRTATTELRRRMSYDQHRNYFKYAAAGLLQRLIARPLVRKALRVFDYYFVGDPGFGAVLAKYRPDVVFLTNLFDDGETALLREAKRRGTPAVGFINSWDKLTARSSLRLLPDTLIVFNDIVKKEAMEHADMPASRIAVCGIPQYDQYMKIQNSKLNTQNVLPREEFCRRKGLDSKRNIILFAPMGPAFSDSDWEMIDLLHSLLGEGRAIPEAQLFVRFQPNDFLDEAELKKRPWLKYDLPGMRFGKVRSVDWDMNFEELRNLIDTLSHTAVLVSYASSMGIDAAIFDKPVINIDFELKSSPPVKSPTFYYRTDHYEKALRAGGMRLVRNTEELIGALKKYSIDPSLDRDGRRRLVQEQCWRLDGGSGERIAGAVIKKLRK